MKPILFFVFCLLLSSSALARVPTLEEVQEKSLAHLRPHLHQSEGWNRKSRRSALLPRLQIGADHLVRDVVSLQTQDSVTITSGDVFLGPRESSLNENLQQGTSFEVKAVWNLSDLLFHQDQLGISREQREWVREKNQELKEVSQAYYAWALLRTIKNLHPKEKLQRESARGVLDAYTQGRFSAQMTAKERNNP